MLRRERQMRAWTQRLLDASLFGIGLWLAHWVRSRSGLEIFGGTKDIEPFQDYLYLFVLLPFTPLLLELQGYYNRPILASRRQAAWMLFRSSAGAVIVAIFALFMLKTHLARSVVILFGF